MERRNGLIWNGKIQVLTLILNLVKEN
jgi:hypothetical protein